MQGPLFREISMLHWQWGITARCMCRRGRGARLKRYLKSTGSTGAPATNAPVEKVSRQCAGLVVPSGATVNSGYLQSLPASKRKPPCIFFPIVPCGANVNSGYLQYSLPASERKLLYFSVHATPGQ